ncbi:MAG: ArdC-like ssDNA-binding domain-containing protein [Clostridiaceae bacterium]
MSYSTTAKNNPDCKSSTSVHEAYEKLQEVLKHINSNESWLQYLSFQSKFYSYSFHNTVLIYSQNPNASYVCGYRKWQTLDRYVKKGEKSLKILAPMMYRSNEIEDDDDLKRLHGFRLVSVFDLAQTDGSDEHLPILVTGLRSTVEGEESLYNTILNYIDIPVEEVPELDSKGRYYIANPRIEIRASLSFVQRIKTLIHEFAHHIHQTRCFADEGHDICEVIAESTAFIVCNVLGLDTTDYSAGYIESWSKDKKSLESVADKIQKISHEIISLISDSEDTPESPSL